tara:strand:- start:317 stop:1588 length:1272 start_codon:yes stop_codon:yes gene_type:complete
MRKIIFLILIINILYGCSSVKYQKLRKQTQLGLSDEFFENQFLGFFVFDPDKNDTIINFNGSKYFTPASNTKIATLYTSINTLPEKIPALKYIISNDTIFIEGTGDPTLLHSYFKDSTAINFLKDYEHITLYLNNFEDEKYGSGWAWEDYGAYFQPERNSFPIYGNVVTIFNTDSLHITPNYFKEQTTLIDFNKPREEKSNTFYINPTEKDTLETPFIIDSTITKIVLENVLHKKIAITNFMPDGHRNTLFSIPSDTLYKRMMKVSDNFLAEQLLILSSSMLSDTLSISKAQKNILSNQLADLKQPPRWVDGSGLSRYNLFTPESLVHILAKLYREQPKERLFNIFPIGGVSGTLKNWFEGTNKPYIYAKTGSLGNNYCLSGYLLTKSGKTLIFSFMNNHYKESTSELKKRMQIILENIRDTY